jgi:hypothetical protein
VQAPRRVGEVLARERDSDSVRSSSGEIRHRARGEQPPERGLPRLQRLLLLAALRPDAGDRVLRVARGGFLRLQRSVGVGDRGFGGAQRVARLAAVGLAALEIGLEGFQARAQRGEILLARGPVRRQRGDQDKRKQDRVQGLALPCAATAAMRRAISSWSPR